MITLIRTDHPRFPWRYTRDAVYLVRGMPHEVEVDLIGRDGIAYARIHWGHLFIYEGYQYEGFTGALSKLTPPAPLAVQDALFQILKKRPQLFDKQVVYDVMQDFYRSDSFSFLEWFGKLWLKLQLWNKTK